MHIKYLNVMANLFSNGSEAEKILFTLPETFL